MTLNTAPPQHSIRSWLAHITVWAKILTRPRPWRRRARASEVLEAVLTTTSDAIFFVDSAGKVRDCNLVAEQMFGRSQSEVIGRGIALLLPSLAFSTLRRRVKGLGHDALPLDMPGRLETLATDQRGTAFPVSVAVRSLSIWGDKGCVVRVRDDSRREADRQQLRRFADQLRVAKNALESKSASLEHQIEGRTSELRRAKEAAESASEAKSSHLT